MIAGCRLFLFVLLMKRREAARPMGLREYACKILGRPGVMAGCPRFFQRNLDFGVRAPSAPGTEKTEFSQVGQWC